MFKHAMFIPQINYAYFCTIIFSKMAFKAIIAGASGLIGSELLGILLKQPEYDAITILVRKPTGLQDKKLTEVILDFDKLDNYTNLIHGHAVFCCMGTTKSKTPDLNVYRKIDHDYPVKLAQLALKNGVKQFHIVTAIGANANSSVFYTRLKGETENDIKHLGVPALHIYQPSQITGDRKEHRPLERIVIALMSMINPMLIGGLKKYRSIPAKTIAMAMFKQSINNDEGVFIHPSNNIKQIA
jgi:uncharacterized protein YbjT (DUF2867 family)